MSLSTLPGRAECEAAASVIPRTVGRWMGEEGPRRYLTIAPGMVRLWSRDEAKWERRLERARESARREAELDARLGAGWDNAQVTGRGRVTGWSAKSRLRMQRAFSAADWTTLFDGSRQAAMVTLTLPHDWVPLCPTAADFKAIVNRWQNAYKAAWGERCRGGWKMEFQLRQACVEGRCNIATAPVAGTAHDPRAPHLHILTVVQTGPPRFRTTSVSGAVAGDFREWLSYSWPKACRTAQVLGREAALVHESAGTAVDVDETIRYADPHRMAVYFGKHGLFEAKDYQNDMPAAWRAHELGGANFWGLWGVPNGGVDVALDPQVSIDLARQLRAHAKAKGRTAPVKVWRSKPLPADMQADLEAELRGVRGTGLSGDPIMRPADILRGLASRDRRWLRVWEDAAGELRLWKRRTVRRRVRRMPAIAGFLLVNDGPQMGQMVARVVAYFGRERGLLDQDDEAYEAARQARYWAARGAVLYEWAGEPSERAKARRTAIPKAG